MNNRRASVTFCNVNTIFFNHHYTLSRNSSNCFLTYITINIDGFIFVFICLIALHSQTTFTFCLLICNWNSFQAFFNILVLYFVNFEMSVVFITFALFYFPHVRFGFLKPRPLISLCTLQFYFIHRIRRKGIQRIVSLKKYVGDRTRTNEMEMGALESQRGIQNIFSEQFFFIPTVLLVDFNVFNGMPTIASVTFKFAPFFFFYKTVW